MKIIKKNLNKDYLFLINYIFFSGLWILSSDRLLSLFLNSSENLALFQTLKGWGFVLVTSLILFLSIQSIKNRHQNSKYHLNLVLNASPSVNYQLEQKGEKLNPIWVSNNIQEIFGYSREEAIDDNWWFSNLHPHDTKKASSAFNKLIKNGKVVHEYRFRHKNNEYLWVRDELHLVKDNKKINIFGCWTNINKEKKNQDILKLNSIVLNSINSGVIVFRSDGIIVTINEAFEIITGYVAEDTIGKSVIKLHHRIISRFDSKKITGELIKNNAWEGEVDIISKSGIKHHSFLSIGSFFSSIDHSQLYYSVVTDLSDIKQKEKSLHRLAHFDSLTGIPNRTSMHIDLENHLKIARKGQEKIAVVFLDLDRFNLINDTAGHNVGDNVLTLVASRLNQILPITASLYRFGGDEFVIILNQLQSTMEVKELASNLRKSLSTPIKLENQSEVNVNASIGASIFPLDGISSSELLSNADAAMHQAKLDSGNKFYFYTKELTLEASNSLNLELQLSRSIKLNELKLFYQPVIDSNSGKIVGAEALIRWQHPSNGLMSPIQFLPLAEKTGLIVEIGSWVVETAIKQVGQWTSLGINPGLISINITSKQINQELFNLVSNCLEKYHVPAHHIELEITESCLIGAGEETIDIFTSFRDIGVKLAIDDFGTGYSSLSYLKNFPLDKLKVDRSFISDLDSNSRAQEMVKAIVSMAHALRLEVQAEGIETQKQLEYITNIGCECWQGYLCSKPIPPADFFDLIKVKK